MYFCSTLALSAFRDVPVTVWQQLVTIGQMVPAVPLSIVFQQPAFSSSETLYG